MVIPKIDDNLTRSNTLVIPDTCPCCGHSTEVKYTDNSKFLICSNPNCSAKLLARFTHFVSRNCVNIDGLSEKTLEQLISVGFLHTYRDIFYLKEHKEELVKLEGMGEKSVSTLLKTIENSRDVKLANFINAIGIPSVGLSTAKDLANYFENDILAFLTECMHTNYTSIDGIGEKTANSIKEWLDDNYIEVFDLCKEFEFICNVKKTATENPFSGKTLCVTGKLNHFTRDSINAKISELGAKASGSVSSKTDYLITNEASGSSKYKKAVELNTPIITESDFLDMINQ
jgi:DNA ligase (NAD+)